MHLIHHRPAYVPLASHSCSNGASINLLEPPLLTLRLLLLLLLFLPAMPLVLGADF
jgi:hypothetical protein